jgi:hypothetical protein
MEADATTFAPICIIDNFYKPINHRQPPTRDTFVETSGRNDKNVEERKAPSGAAELKEYGRFSRVASATPESLTFGCPGLERPGQTQASRRGADHCDIFAARDGSNDEIVTNVCRAEDLRTR